METRRVTVRLPFDLIERLKAQAVRHGHLLSDAIRDALTYGLTPPQPPRPPQQPLLRHDGGEQCVAAILRHCVPAVQAWVQSESERLECAPALVVAGALYWAIEEQAGHANT